MSKVFSFANLKSQSIVDTTSYNALLREMGDVDFSGVQICEYMGIISYKGFQPREFMVKLLNEIVRSERGKSIDSMIITFLLRGNNYTRMNADENQKTLVSMLTDLKFVTQTNKVGEARTLSRVAQAFAQRTTALLFTMWVIEVSERVCKIPMLGAFTSRVMPLFHHPSIMAAVTPTELQLTFREVLCFLSGRLTQVLRKQEDKNKGMKKLSFSEQVRYIDAAFNSDTVDNSVRIGIFKALGKVDEEGFFVFYHKPTQEFWSTFYTDVFTSELNEMFTDMPTLGLVMARPLGTANKDAEIKYKKALENLADVDLNAKRE